MDRPNDRELLRILGQLTGLQPQRNHTLWTNCMTTEHNTFQLSCPLSNSAGRTQVQQLHATRQSCLWQLQTNALASQLWLRLVQRAPESL